MNVNDKFFKDQAIPVVGWGSIQEVGKTFNMAEKMQGKSGNKLKKNYKERGDIDFDAKFTPLKEKDTF